MTDPLLSGRWSPSVFDPAYEISDGELEQLLTAAQWAPSWGNSQPWAYVVLRRGTSGHDVLLRHLSRGNAGWVPRASVVLVATTQTGTAPDGPDGKPGKEATDVYAWHDLGQATAHVTLEARALGLDAHQFAGFDHDAVAAALGVPAHRTVRSAVAIGRHAPGSTDDERLLEREARPRRRKDLSEIAFGEEWGRPWR